MKNIKPKYTRSQVIAHLNDRFKSYGWNIAFRPAECVDYSIEAYIPCNKMIEAITSYRFTEQFYTFLLRILILLDIEGETLWNNDKTAFTCWEDNKTCSWTNE